MRRRIATAAAIEVRSAAWTPGGRATVAADSWRIRWQREPGAAGSWTQMPAAASGRPIAARATTHHEAETQGAPPTAPERAAAEALEEAWAAAHGRRGQGRPETADGEVGRPETRRRGWTVAAPDDAGQPLRADEARLRAGDSEARGAIALDGTIVPTAASGPEAADLTDRLARTAIRRSR